MYFDILKRQVSQFKNSEEGRLYMCEAMERFVPSQGTADNYRIRGMGTAGDSKTVTSFRASHRSSTGNGAGWNRSFRVSYVVED